LPGYRRHVLDGDQQANVVDDLKEPFERKISASEVNRVSEQQAGAVEAWRMRDLSSERIK